jgi:hypothetical protein
MDQNDKVRKNAVNHFLFFYLVRISFRSCNVLPPPRRSARSQSNAIPMDCVHLPTALCGLRLCPTDSEFSN